MTAHFPGLDIIFKINFIEKSWVKYDFMLQFEIYWDVWFMVFQQYFSYIVEVTFIGGGNRIPGENYRPATRN